jgi:hypothetical protein
MPLLFILQMKKLRFRDTKQFVQGHTKSKECRWGSYPDLNDSRASCCASLSLYKA